MHFSRIFGAFLYIFSPQIYYNFCIYANFKMKKRTSISLFTRRTNVYYI